MGVIENRIDILELERSGGGGGGGTAASVSYDNTSSGLSAATVQGAIDEVTGNLGDLEDEKAGKDQISNRNLLDNGWFTVNQRGKTTYNETGYTVDRWMILADQDITVSRDGISTENTAQFHQRIEPSVYADLIGKTVTASVLLSDGTILKASGLVTAENGTYITIDTDDLYVILTKDAYNFFFMVTFKTTTVTVKAVKLEIGSVSTLDMDTIPNYAEELLKCQRYFIRLLLGDAYSSLGCGSSYSETSAEIAIPIPVTMRAKPTLSGSGSFMIRGGGAYFSVTLNLISQMTAVSVTLVVNGTDITSNTAYELFVNNDSSAVIDLVADL